jgi:shikimate kinase
VTDARHLVLVGLMGVGKTTVGRRCADRLGRPFVDTDDLVQTLAGVPVAELFATQGEAAFRALEKQAVADVCESPEALVIACGGGAVLDAENRARLRAAGVVVWLQASVAVLAGRVGTGATRPLLAGDPVGSLRRLGALRDATYEAAAHETVTADSGVDAVADAVLAVFGARATELA